MHLQNGKYGLGLITVVCGLLFSPSLFLCELLVGQTEQDELNLQLQQSGIGPTRAGIITYLDSLQPDPKRAAEIKPLIQQLGSSNYKTRIAAFQKLQTIAPTDVKWLQESHDHTDPEIRLRVRMILRQIQLGNHLANFQLALSWIQKNDEKGLTEKLFQAMEVLDVNTSTRLHFKRCLLATVEIQDEAHLQSLVRNPSAKHRDIALAALIQLNGKSMLDQLAELASSDPAEDIKLIAAQELATQADLRSVQPLLRLLKSPSPRVRSKSISILRAITGKRFQYGAHTDRLNRDKEIVKWNDWFGREKESLVLFKLDQKSLPVMDRMIVSTYTKKKIYELDMQGKILRQIDTDAVPMGVFGLPDGNIVVCDYSNKRVLELDSDSKVIWKVEKLPGNPLSVERLPNGNTLIGASDSRKALEYDPAGTVVWEAKLPGRINVVHRTLDGTTMVSMLGENKIVELDANGKTIFELKVNKPNGVRKTDRGNYLVCLYEDGAVNEYTPSGEIVWSVRGLKKPCRAQRRDDGTTIIYGRSGVGIYGSNGKSIREVTVPDDSTLLNGVGSFHYF